MRRLSLVTLLIAIVIVSGCSERGGWGNADQGDVKAVQMMSKANQRLGNQASAGRRLTTSPELKNMFNQAIRKSEAQTELYNSQLKKWQAAIPASPSEPIQIENRSLIEKDILLKAIDAANDFLSKSQKAKILASNRSLIKEINQNQSWVRSDLLTLRETVAAFYPDPRSDTASASYPKGNQNRTNLAIISCRPSHINNDDPIVHANRPGMSHRHQFFGNSLTNANPSLRRLVRGTTSCIDQEDLSAYWVAALLDKGNHVVQPTKLRAYYGGNGGNQAIALPKGLRMIAGNASSLGWQDPEIAGWACTQTDLSEPVPPNCKRETILRLRFPDCWDGKNLDSQDHYSHVAYSRGERCPRKFPKKMVQLRYDIHYPVSNIIGPDGQPNYHVSSGPIWTIHGDVLSLWSNRRLERLVRECVVGGRNCPQ